MADYQTFAGWAARGRSVRRGERANFYAVDNDTGEGFAVFSEDQTEQLQYTGPSPNFTLVPAETYKANRQPNKGLLTVQVELKNGTYAFWVGNAPKLTKLFKDGGYSWNPARWRWQSGPRVTADPQKVIEKIDASPDYLLVREGELA